MINGDSDLTEPQLFTPRGKFQTEATQFAFSHKRAQLNIDMGLGKTSIMLDLIRSLTSLGESDPVLVIAPLRVAKNTWVDEAAKWQHTCHLKVVPIIGDRKQRIAAINTPAHIYCINYENIAWLVEWHGKNWPYATVIADESTKLKSCRSSIQTSKTGTKFVRAAGGARTGALSKIAFSGKVKRWINLTGTFSPNGLEQIWGQMWFIDGGKRLGNTFTAFQDRWFKVGYNGYGLTALPHAEAEIRELISDVCFTLRAEDYLDLPKEITNNIFVDIPHEQMLLYRQMEKEFFIQIQAGDVEAFSAATKSAKCHQIANGAIYWDKQGSWEWLHDAKVEALQDIVEEMGGSPLIVVYKFKSDLIRLQKAFPQGRKFDQNPKTEKAFKNGEIPILFIQCGSDPHGTDGFQMVCNTIVFFSLDWNGENRLQVIARIGAVRQFQAGLKRTVIIHNLLSRGTIDEDILDRLENDLTVEESLKRGMARRGLK